MPDEVARIGALSNGSNGQRSLESASLHFEPVCRREGGKANREPAGEILTLSFAEGEGSALCVSGAGARTRNPEPKAKDLLLRRFGGVSEALPKPSRTGADSPAPSPHAFGHREPWDSLRKIRASWQAAGWLRAISPGIRRTCAITAGAFPIFYISDTRPAHGRSGPKLIGSDPVIRAGAP
jgi:hypothetical protein